MTFKSIEGSLIMLEVIAENEKEGKMKNINFEEERRYTLYTLREDIQKLIQKRKDKNAATEKIIILLKKYNANIEEVLN